MKKFIVVMLAALGLAGQASGEDRRALVMFVGGGVGRGSTAVQDLCNKYEPLITELRGEIQLVHQADVPIWRYFYSPNTLSPHKFSKYTHLALVGHSLGGHAAYKLARMVTTHRGNSTSVLLVTLDPTRLGFLDTYRDIPNPHRWLNVHIPRNRRRSSGRLIAWGHELNANRNYVFQSPYANRTGHYQIRALFQAGGVDQEVMDFIGQSTRLSSSKDICTYGD